MKIISSEKMENCFDGDFVFKYIFDAGWTREDIIRMEAWGSLRYYESFPRPMFQVTCSDGTIIKGVQNDPACRIIFPRATPAAARENFEARFGELSVL
ncbi:MAG: hypothetical protein FWG14_05370 [Peptococcaceae bacterium]|nr:hypothetical protein [Peptococcaceae bacterium]